MKILNLAAIGLLFVFTACCTSGKTTNGAAQNENMENSKMVNKAEMMEAGFTMGTIVASTAEDDCPFVIKSEIDGNEVMFDPINLDAGYKTNGMNVWYKYTGLRMANRCNKANPITLTEIQAIK